MSREKQIEEAPKITKIYEPIEVTDEMRKLADEMQKAISDEYRRRVFADERKLEAVLKENGWRKASEVAREIFEEIDKLLKKNELRNYEPCNVESYYSGDLETDLAQLKKKYLGEDNNVTTNTEET